MNSAVTSLDAALGPVGSSQGVGEDIILRRPVGYGSAQQFVQVTCRARVYPVSNEQVTAGYALADMNFVMSPTQINDRQWPGGHVEQLPPFNVDQRIPRASLDEFIARGAVRQIVKVVPYVVGGELVRIEGVMKG